MVNPTHMVAIAIAVAATGCLIHTPATPAQRAAARSKTIHERLAAGPGASDRDPRRADFESLWSHELDLDRDADTIGSAMFGHDRTDAELAELCPMNAEAATALAQAYAQDPDRQLAFAIEVVLRFGAAGFARCPAFAPHTWQPILESSVAIAHAAPLLREGWIRSAAGHRYVIAIGRLNGIFSERVNGKSHRITLAVRGHRVLGTDTRVEALSLHASLSGLFLSPEYVTRNVVEDRDDEAIVLDAPPTGHGWDGELGDQPSSVVLIELHGQTEYRPDPGKVIHALAGRAIAIGTPEHWNWVAWSPRRVLAP